MSGRRRMWLTRSRVPSKSRRLALKYSSIASGVIRKRTNLSSAISSLTCSLMLRSSRPDSARNACIDVPRAASWPPSFCTAACTSASATSTSWRDSSLRSKASSTSCSSTDASILIRCSGDGLEAEWRRRITTSIDERVIVTSSMMATGTVPSVEAGASSAAAPAPHAMPAIMPATVAARVAARRARVVAATCSFSLLVRRVWYATAGAARSQGRRRW